MPKTTRWKRLKLSGCGIGLPGRPAHRMPSLPAARISHFTARRLRIKVPEKRRDSAFFDTVAERLATWDSIEGVETNPLTASVLIHFSDPERLFLEAAVKNDLFDIDLDAAFGGSPEPPVTEAA